MPLHNIARPETIQRAIERTQLRLDTARRHVVPMVLNREEITEHETRILAELRRVLPLTGGCEP